MLSNYTIEKRDIELPGGGSFAVQGLSFQMVATLVTQGFREQIGEVVKDLSPLFDSPEKASEIDFGALVHELLPKVPELIAAMVALATGEKDQATARTVWLSLPASIQLESLLAVGELTFVGEHSVKKFVAGLITMFNSTTKAMDETTVNLNNRRLNGTGTANSGDASQTSHLPG